jgi:hypothetical protein
VETIAEPIDYLIIKRSVMWPSVQKQERRVLGIARGACSELDRAE